MKQLTKKVFALFGGLFLTHALVSGQAALQYGQTEKVRQTESSSTTNAAALNEGGVKATEVNANAGTPAPAKVLVRDGSIQSIPVNEMYMYSVDDQLYMKANPDQYRLVSLPVNNAEPATKIILTKEVFDTLTPMKKDYILNHPEEYQVIND